MRDVAIDLNADVGESFGAWRLGEDERLIPLVSSVNVACGFHAGDPSTIERTIALAARAGVAIGAHPGYPDLPGFGRRDLDLSPADLEASIVYQVGAVAAFARAAGRDLVHVKPHGALYNRSARDAATAEAVARGVRRVSADLVLVGLAGSVSLDAGRAAGLAVAGEGFADRRYEPDGRLRDRRHPDAVLADPADTAAQAVRIARDRTVEAVGGESLDLAVDTLCVHGDQPGAAARAAAVRTALEQAGIDLRPLR
jgi:5-oxoprolinase (ATP-hydrolysing) subunit A